jgi:hypothetical protein
MDWRSQPRVSSGASKTALVIGAKFKPPALTYSINQTRYMHRPMEPMLSSNPLEAVLVLPEPGAIHACTCGCAAISDQSLDFDTAPSSIHYYIQDSPVQFLLSSPWCDETHKTALYFVKVSAIRTCLGYPLVYLL